MIPEDVCLLYRIEMALPQQNLCTGCFCFLNRSIYNDQASEALLVDRLFLHYKDGSEFRILVADRLGPDMMTSWWLVPAFTNRIDLWAGTLRIWVVTGTDHLVEHFPFGHDGRDCRSAMGVRWGSRVNR